MSRLEDPWQSLEFAEIVEIRCNYHGDWVMRNISGTWNLIQFTGTSDDSTAYPPTTPSADANIYAGNGVGPNLWTDRNYWSAIDLGSGKVYCKTDGIYAQKFASQSFPAPSAATVNPASFNMGFYSVDHNNDLWFHCIASFVPATNLTSIAVTFRSFRVAYYGDAADKISTVQTFSFTGTSAYPTLTRGATQFEFQDHKLGAALVVVNATIGGVSSPASVVEVTATDTATGAAAPAFSFALNVTRSIASMRSDVPTSPVFIVTTNATFPTGTRTGAINFNLLHTGTPAPAGTNGICAWDGYTYSWTGAGSGPGRDGTVSESCTFSRQLTSTIGAWYKGDGTIEYLEQFQELFFSYSGSDVATATTTVYTEEQLQECPGPVCVQAAAIATGTGNSHSLKSAAYEARYINRLIIGGATRNEHQWTRVISSSNEQDVTYTPSVVTIGSTCTGADSQDAIVTETYTPPPGGGGTLSGTSIGTDTRTLSGVHSVTHAVSSSFVGSYTAPSTLPTQLSTSTNTIFENSAQTLTVTGDRVINGQTYTAQLRRFSSKQIRFTCTGPSGTRIFCYGPDSASHDTGNFSGATPYIALDPKSGAFIVRSAPPSGQTYTYGFIG